MATGSSRSPKLPLPIEPADFSVLEELQRSAGGAVYLARHRPTNRRIVLKERRVSELGPTRELDNELALWEKLPPHPNLIGFLGSYWRDSSARSARVSGSGSERPPSGGRDGHAIFVMVFDYAEQGDLHSALKKQRACGRYLSEKQVLQWFVPILSGVAHLHAHGIVHRDLKSLNILLTGGTPKLCDLGISRLRSEDTLFLRSFCGTPAYLSPEMVATQPYTEKTDVWGCGIILYELASLQLPFQGDSLPEISAKIVRGSFPPLPRHYSEHLCKLVKAMLHADSPKRPSVRRAIEYCLWRLDRISEASGGSAANGSHGAQSGGKRAGDGADHDAPSEPVPEPALLPPEPTAPPPEPEAAPLRPPEQGAPPPQSREDWATGGPAAPTAAHAPSDMLAYPSQQPDMGQARRHRDLDGDLDNFDGAARHQNRQPSRGGRRPWGEEGWARPQRPDSAAEDVGGRDRNGNCSSAGAYGTDPSAVRSAVRSDTPTAGLSAHPHIDAGGRGGYDDGAAQPPQVLPLARLGRVPGDQLNSLLPGGAARAAAPASEVYVSETADSMSDASSAREIRWQQRWAQRESRRASPSTSSGPSAHPAQRDARSARQPPSSCGPPSLSGSDASSVPGIRLTQEQHGMTAQQVQAYVLAEQLARVHACAAERLSGQAEPSLATDALRPPSSAASLRPPSTGPPSTASSSSERRPSRSGNPTGRSPFAAQGGAQWWVNVPSRQRTPALWDPPRLAQQQQPLPPQPLRQRHQLHDDQARSNPSHPSPPRQHRSPQQRHPAPAHQPSTRPPSQQEQYRHLAQPPAASPSPPTDREHRERAAAGGDRGRSGRVGNGHDGEQPAAGYRARSEPRVPLRYDIISGQMR